MTENLEIKTQQGKDSRELVQRAKLDHIRSALSFIEFYKNLGGTGEMFYSELNLLNKNYKELTESYKEQGIEFPEVQKQYEKMLPRINKYLKSEEVKSN